MNRSKALVFVGLITLSVGLCAILFWPNGEPFTQAQERVELEIDDSDAIAAYANICRVTLTRREVFFDFAVSTGLEGSDQSEVPINRRIVTNLYTAKRMLHAVKLTVQRHEATFGVLQNEDDGRRTRVDLDDSRVVPTYANFCRVTGTPEEVIIDFGLNPQPFGVPTEPIPVSWRTIANFHIAKLLLRDLDAAIGRHEAKHGVLETDVQRRIRADAFTSPKQ